MFPFEMSRGGKRAWQGVGGGYLQGVTRLAIGPTPEHMRGRNGGGRAILAGSIESRDRKSMGNSLMGNWSKEKLSIVRLISSQIGINR